jgi:hypothetical protein
MGAKRRYVNGLEKLAYAEIEVAQMSKDLEALQPQLKVAAEEAEVMIGVIEVESNYLLNKLSHQNRLLIFQIPIYKNLFVDFLEHHS